jgi:hypothetical protein
MFYALKNIIHHEAADIINNNQESPPLFTLQQNYPNPFNQTTVIRFTNKNSGFMAISFYNSSGQLIKILVNEYKTVGEHPVHWDGMDEKGNKVSSGIYFYVLKTSDIKVLSKK